MAFFLVFWHWFWQEFEIGNCFFWVFWVFFLFFCFFGRSLGQHSKLETGLFGSFGFFFLFFFWFFFWDFLVFWYLNLGLEYHPKKNKKKPKKNKKPKKTQKKPKKNQKTSRNSKIGKLALVFRFFGFLKFSIWHFFWFFWHWFWPEFEIGNCFFWVFLGFFCFFVFLAEALVNIRNWKLVFSALLVFFCFFLVFFWDFLVFWYLNLGLEYHPKKNKKKNQKKTKKPKKKQKNPKKNQKTSRNSKIGKLAWFFGFFWGEHPPSFQHRIRFKTTGESTTLLELNLLNWKLRSCRPLALLPLPELEY